MRGPEIHSKSRFEVPEMIACNAKDKAKPWRRILDQRLNLWPEAWLIFIWWKLFSSDFSHVLNKFGKGISTAFVLSSVQAGGPSDSIFSPGEDRS